ncbi:hypothetical protein QCD79_32745, partial [Pseudomonas quasicaspiana]|nr:hypothetical protein [Pseudomonas quasicaspiana]
KGSDLGGGCSTMGTLSGGGNIVIKVGEGCLIGANAGIGTDQAAFAYFNDDVAATGQGTHGGATAAQVRAFADE